MHLGHFTDVDVLWQQLIGSLLIAKAPAESRDGPVAAEIIGMSLSLDASYQRTFLSNSVRNLSPSYAAAETLWYLSGSDDIDMLKVYAPSYVNFGDENGKAFGAYGPPLMSHIWNVIRSLKSNRLTRRAVIMLWQDKHGDKIEYESQYKDIPCTLSMQFLVRANKLHLVVGMRSNDAWLGFPYDLFAFTCIQRLVAAHVGCEVGNYFHTAGSMHLYERNLEKAQEAYKITTWKAPQLSHNWKLDDTVNTAQLGVAIEKAVRRRVHWHTLGLEMLGDMVHDLLRCCALKVGDGYNFGPIKSESLSCRAAKKS